MLDRFFTVLIITPSFLVRFWPVKCRIEALIMLFRMVKERSVRFSFQSGQRSGQTLVKLGQIWSKLPKLWEMYPRPHFEGFSAWWTLFRSGKAQSNPGQHSVNLGQTWSGFGKRAPDPVLRLFGVADLRQIRPAWFGLSRFACRHQRKSRG